MMMYVDVVMMVHLRLSSGYVPTLHISFSNLLSVSMMMMMTTPFEYHSNVVTNPLPERMIGLRMVYVVGVIHIYDVSVHRTGYVRRRYMVMVHGG